MASLFRSEDMQLLQIFIQADVAIDALKELGELGILQFKDVRPSEALLRLSHRTLPLLLFFFVSSSLLRPQVNMFPFFTLY
jgi:vacuolar-type H+-ATPase subunit I/STV1